jgi:hypothetical protein
VLLQETEHTVHHGLEILGQGVTTVPAEPLHSRAVDAHELRRQHRRAVCLVEELLHLLGNRRHAVAVAVAVACGGGCGAQVCLRPGLVGQSIEMVSKDVGGGGERTKRGLLDDHLGTVRLA